MDERIYFLTKELKEEMNKDERFIALLDAEEKMMNDEEVIRLSIKKEEALNKYSDLLNVYDKNSSEVKKAKEALDEAVNNLDKNPLVRSYQEAYKEVNIVLHKMNEILFKDLKEK